MLSRQSQRHHRSRLFSRSFLQSLSPLCVWFSFFLVPLSPSLLSLSLFAVVFVSLTGFSDVVLASIQLFKNPLYKKIGQESVGKIMVAHRMTYVTQYLKVFCISKSTP